MKKGIRWWYKFDLSGKTYASKCIYLTKNEAKKAETAHYEELNRQERNPSQKPVLSLLEAINERLDYVLTKKSKTYYRDNKRYYTILVNELGDVSIEEVKKNHINAILLQMSDRLQNEDKDNYAVNAALRVYKALFQYAIKSHDLDIKNPCVGIDMYSIDKHMKFIPPDADIEAVRKLCDTDQRLLLDFVKDTGCRISEALRLKGEDVSETHVILYTRKSKNSNLVPRKVPLSIHVSGEKRERVFKRWTDIPRFLEDKVRSLEQKPWSWHSLRHRYASLLSKEGKPLFEIMSLLGHSNLETTQIYLQLL
ncbi:MAG: site-specific integrase [Ignavibacteriae bacterium]|nr:MAG: site-specific integrase [Ignavibacteriota bacterium]